MPLHHRQRRRSHGSYFLSKNIASTEEDRGRKSFPAFFQQPAKFNGAAACARAFYVPPPYRRLKHSPYFHFATLLKIAPATDQIVYSSIHAAMTVRVSGMKSGLRKAQHWRAVESTAWPLWRTGTVDGNHSLSWLYCLYSVCGDMPLEPEARQICSDPCKVHGTVLENGCQLLIFFPSCGIQHPHHGSKTDHCNNCGGYI